MFENYRVLDVQKTGPCSVVALKSDRLSDVTVVERLFDEIDQYLRSGECEVLVIDIDGIQTLPSSFLGRLVDLRRRVKVELKNPSDYVTLVLETAQLDKLFAAAGKPSPATSSESDPTDNDHA